MKKTRTDADSLFSITFDPKCFTGSYRVLDSLGDMLTDNAGPITLRLTAGNYFVLVGNGSFGLTVTSKGEIAPLGSTVPATISGPAKNRLVFKTATIIVDPGAYDGNYFPAGHYDIQIRGKQEVVVVPTISWYVDVYGAISGSRLSFLVNASGKIDPASVLPKSAADASGNTLTFQTTQIKVDPGDFDANYIPAGHYCEPSNGVNNFALVKELTCYLEFYGCGWQSEVYFNVDKLGHIDQTTVTNSQAVTATNLTGPGPTAKLVANTQEVTIATDFTGRFRIGSQFFQASARKKGKKGAIAFPPFVMVKNVTTFISIVDNVYTLITPFADAMVPSVALVQGADGTSAEFDFSY